MKIQWSGLLGLVMLMMIGCASSEYMLPTSTIYPAESYQITDRSIREAFEARPQIGLPLNLALYNPGERIPWLADSLESLADVRDVYEISPFFLEGERYYQRLESPWYSRYMAPPATNIDRLRLLAAHGKADVLVFCNFSHRYVTKSNALAWLYIGLITMAFIPGQSFTLTTAADVAVVDVRNGLIYATYRNERSITHPRVNIDYATTSEFEQDKSTLVHQLYPEVSLHINRVLHNEDFYLASPNR